MSGELTVHNLADTVRDKVRTTIVNSIPDDQIDKLVQNEWKQFFDKPTDRWNSNDASPFQKMVRAEIEKLIRERVVVEVNAELDRFQKLVWENNARGSIREMVKVYAPSVLEGMAESMAVQCLNKLTQNRTF